MKTSFVTLLGILLLQTGWSQAAVIAYWRFENNLLDSSGNGLNASTSGSGFSYSTQVPGAFIDVGNETFLPDLYSYNRPSTGTADTTTVAASSLLTNSFAASSFTVEAFVYLNPTGQNGSLTILQNRFGGNSGVSFLVGRQGATYNALFAGTNGSGTTSVSLYDDSSGLSAEAWHHVAWVGTFNGTNTTVKFYLDGVEDSYTAFYAGGLTMNSETWKIGGASNNFNGLIDELRLSNAALAPSQFLIATAVPEAGSLSLLLGGGAMVLLCARRRIVRA